MTFIDKCRLLGGSRSCLKQCLFFVDSLLLKLNIKKTGLVPPFSWDPLTLRSRLHAACCGCYVAYSSASCPLNEHDSKFKIKMKFQQNLETHVFLVACVCFLFGLVQSGQTLIYPKPNERNEGEFTIVLLWWFYYYYAATLLWFSGFGFWFWQTKIEH